MPRLNRARKSRRAAPARPTYVVVPPSSAGVTWRAALLTIVGALAYLNSLSNPFIFDDYDSIVNNGQIRRLWDLSNVLFPARESPVAGRPIVNASFAINYAISGLNVGSYHIWNIAVHVLAAILVFAIVRRALQLPRLPAMLGEHSTNLAFAAALIWMLHPLNTEAVDYLTQRTESMMALFYLLTLYASLRDLTARKTAKWRVVAVMSCAVGMGCKESMVTAPVLVVLFDRIFVFDSLSEAFRKRSRLYMGLAATWLILGALMSTGPRRRTVGFFVGVSPLTYFLNQLQMITRYLREAVWPTSLVANYGWPPPLTLGEVWPYAVWITCLLTLVVVSLWRWPMLGFLGAWFFITLAPTSSIVPIATEVGAERRMYLPLIGLVVLAVTGVAVLWGVARDKIPLFVGRPKAVTFGAISVLAGVSVALAAGTLARNREYSSGLVLARTVLARNPTPIAHHSLAVELLNTGSRQEAMMHLRRALPGAPGAHMTLGAELFEEGKMDEAIVELRMFVREQPYHARVAGAHEYIGRALASQQRWPEAINEFQEMLKIDPSNPTAHYLLADTLFSQQAFDEAVPHYLTYLDTRWNDADALNQLGIAFGSTGKLDDAIVAFRRAAGIDPMNGPVQRNLANALWARRNFEEALPHARQAVILQPNDADSHAVLGRILEQQGRLSEASAEFERSLQLDPTLATARADLERLRQRGTNGSRQSP